MPKTRFYPGPGLRGECVEHHIPRRASARSKGTEGDENPMVFMGKWYVFTGKSHGFDGILWFYCFTMFYWEKLTVFTGKSHGFTGKSKVFDWTVQCFYSKIQYYLFPGKWWDFPLPRLICWWLQISERWFVLFLVSGELVSAFFKRLKIQWRNHRWSCRHFGDRTDRTTFSDSFCSLMIWTKMWFSDSGW